MTTIEAPTPTRLGRFLFRLFLILGVPWLLLRVLYVGFRDTSRAFLFAFKVGGPEAIPEIKRRWWKK